MRFLLDLEKMSLVQFQSRLAGQDLLPSRKILHEEIEPRFALLAAQGVQTLGGLIAALKTKKHVLAFAEQTGLPVDYLTILRREALSYQPKAVALAKFPGAEADVLARLASQGIRQSFDLIEHSQTAADRAALAEKNGVAEDTILELLFLADLARVNGVGPVFARMLLDAGVPTSAALAGADAAALYAELMALNQVHEYTRARFTEKDMAYCIEMAGLLPAAAVYYAA